MYESASNGLSIEWNYQSQNNAIQSLSWSYKLDGGSYSSPVTGTDSVNGASWLSGVSYGSHTLYVALLDQGTGIQLTADSHSFTYESGTAPISPEIVDMKVQKMDTKVKPVRMMAPPNGHLPMPGPQDD